MNWNKIEEHLRQSASEEQAYINTAALWDTVKPHIPKKKRRRFWPYWILGLGVIILGGMWLTSQTKWNKNHLDKERIQEYSLTENQKSVATPSIIEVDPLNKSEDLSQITEKSLPHAKGIMSRAKEQHADVEIPLHSKRVLSYSDAENIHTLISRNNKSAASDDTYYMREAIKPLTPDLKHNILLPVDRISMAPFDNASVNMPSAPLVKKIVIRPQFTPFYYHQFEAGVAWKHDHLTSSSTEWSSHLAKRKYGERALPSWQANYKIGKQLTKTWSIAIGISYIRLFKESLAELNEQSTIDIDNGITQIVHTADGQAIRSGNTSALQDISTRARRINRFSMFSTPLRLNYTHRLGPLLTDIGTGIIFTWSKRQSGYIHPFTTEEYDLSTDKDNWYHNRPLWSSPVYIDLRYPTTDRVDFYLSTAYQHYWNGITTQNYGISEKLSGFQMNIGIRINNL